MGIQQYMQVHTGHSSVLVLHIMRTQLPILVEYYISGSPTGISHTFSSMLSLLNV